MMSQLVFGSLIGITVLDIRSSTTLRFSELRLNQSGSQNIKMFRVIVGTVVLLGMVFPACSQLVRLQFNSLVTQASGSPLAGVAVGSTITGQIQVNLATLPSDSNPLPWFGGYDYSGGVPGYTFQFDTGLQTVSYDSVNAAGDGGLTPGLFLQPAADAEFFSLQARDAGNPFGVVLRFRGSTNPLALVSGDYFPEDVHLAAGLDNADFLCFNKYGDIVVAARVTSASLVVDPTNNPCVLLSYRVNASALPAKHKRELLGKLQSADQAFAKGREKTGLKHLAKFQKRLRDRVEKRDTVLFKHLMAGAESLIDSHPPKPKP